MTEYTGSQGIGLYKAQGIVLRAIRLGEADRIITFYTQSHGRVRAVAKGIRKSKSRFGGRLDAFTHVDLLLYKGRSDLDIVTGAEIITRPRRIRTDYGSFCAASAMADAIDRTTPERERNVRAFLLLRSGLLALDEGAADPPLLAYAFLAKLTAMAGLHPTLGVCVDCESTDVAAFSYARGGVVCARCVERADPQVSAEVRSAWSMLLDREWTDLLGHRFPPDIRAELGSLLLAFVQWHMESRFKAFTLLPSSFAN